MTDKGLQLHVTGITDVGSVRKNNEDAIAYTAEHGLVILADGMGGHNAGEVASQLAVETVEHHLLPVMSSEEASNAPLEDELQHAVARANTAVYDRAHSALECNGMGTTLVVAAFRDGNLHIANVGDSRLYRFHAGQLEQLTRDHSLVGEMVERGFMTREEAQNSPQKNIITRAIGMQPEVEVDLFQHEVQADALYLLCSDGLTDVVSDDGIRRIMEQHLQDPDAISQQLVAQAISAGGPDNISVIVVALESN